MTHDEALAKALPLARGCYQRDVLLGRERISGAGLRGKAAEYAGKYARSRKALLARLSAAGVPWRIDRPARGPYRLVLGE